LAQSGECSDTHAGIAKDWHRHLVKNKLVVSPFQFHLNTIIEKEVKKEIKKLRNNNKYKLTQEPHTEGMAMGVVYSYLSGTSEYQRWTEKNKFMPTKDFKKLNVNDFYTRPAQEFRDKRFKNKKVNFLTQAFRFRGKAHYRDSIYLTYGEDKIEQINQLILDLETIATKYLKMACFYIKKRVDKTDYTNFCEDIRRHSRLEINFSFPTQDST